MKGVIFRVSTGLTLVLFVLAFMRATFLSFIPPLPANEKLLHQPGEYVQQGLHQPVDWNPLISGGVYGDAFEKARKLHLPVLLAIGAPWSQTARTIDNGVFNSPDVARLVNENFVAVRIDCMQQPRWASCFLPLSRMRMSFSGGFQVYVIDPNGDLVAYIGTTSGGQDLNTNNFSDLLVSALNQIGRPATAASWTLVQRQDASILKTGQPGALPPFGSFADALAAQSGGAEGGFVQGDVNRLEPLAWLYELRTGRGAQMRSSLDPMLTSPITDIVRGGFFGFRTVRGTKMVDFDQVTTLNAEMADLLAEASDTRDDPFDRFFAIRTFDMLIRDLTDEQLFDACRLSDVGARNRSDSASYPDSRTNGALTDGETSLARQELGLSEGTNPQMVPFLSSRDVLQDRNLPDVLDALRAIPSPPTVNGGLKCLDVTGHTAACLLRCARLLGDHDRLVKVLDTVDSIQQFRKGDDVTHLVPDKDAPSTPENLGTYLGDYLAYSDAELQDYICTGRIASFKNGLEVLRRAVERFSSGSSGVFIQSLQPDPDWLPKSIETPEVADDVRESDTSQMVRLLEDYGRMLGPGEEGTEMLDLASRAIEKCPTGPVGMSSRLAGLYIGAATFADPQCAFSVGPNAQELADKLFRMRPSRLVAPAFGPVRPGLQNLRPGIYVANGSIVAGPYTIEQAAAVMPPAYQVGADQ